MFVPHKSKDFLTINFKLEEILKNFDLQYYEKIPSEKFC